MSEIHKIRQGSILPSFSGIIYQICQEEGIKMQLLCNNWIKRLEKNHTVKYITGHKFGLNSQSAGLIADDKYSTYSTLEYAGIPAVEHVIMYDFANSQSYAKGRNSLVYVKDYFENHSKHIVIKPACGSGGQQVYQVTDEQKLLPTLIDIFSNHPTACLSPFYEIRKEYRVILLDQEARLAYQKSLPNQKNWKFNLQQGAQATAIPKEKLNSILPIARLAAEKLDLRFCSVDIIETAETEYLVLEVNSGVMIDNYLQQHPDQLDLVKAIYRDAVRKMF